VQLLKNYGIIQLGEELWVVADIIATTDTRDAAWRALGRRERGCVVETAPGRWMACRATVSRPTRESSFNSADGAAFESRCSHLDNEDPVTTWALKDLLMRGDARFERALNNDEQWYAL
jgi:hypothetical protein